MKELDLFSSKYKMSFAEFWRNFYDSQIFDFSTILTNSVKLLFQNSRSSFAEHLVVNSVKLRSDRFWAISWVGGGADEFYSKIDRTLLSREIVAFRMELFGSEWLSQLEKTPYYSKHEISDIDRFAEMSFAKNYLEQKGRSDIWDAMLDYNKSIENPQFPEIVLNDIRKMSKTELEHTFYTICLNRHGIYRLEWEAERLAIMLANRLGFDIEIDSKTWSNRLPEMIIKLIHLEISHLFYNLVVINPSRHEVTSKS